LKVGFGLMGGGVKLPPGFIRPSPILACIAFLLPPENLPGENMG
jgi:hypothetical protein